MDCKEFQRLIPDYINQKLDFRVLDQFNEHRKNCEDCQEELVIRFLVTEGIQRLEEGDAFDLQKELRQHLEEAEKRIRFHKCFLCIGEILEAAAILTVVAGILWIVI